MNKREVVYEKLWNVEDSSIVSRGRRSSSSSSDEDGGVEVVDGGQSTDNKRSQGPVSLPYFATNPPAVPDTGHRPGPSNVLGLQKKEGLPPLPPSPPPRPGKTHMR